MAPSEGAPPPTQKISEVIGNFRPAKGFKIGNNAVSTSLDFDDLGEFVLSANSDESLKIYNAREGKEEKTLLSKKYGCHLARFTHQPSSIIYASTKGDDNIRYLSTHDNSYLRYFRGHTAPVTSLAMSPGQDTFVSCSLDNTLRLWDLNSASYTGKLNLATPTLCAYDPTASVIGVASPSTSTLLLYDVRNYEKGPFAAFDLSSQENLNNAHIAALSSAGGSNNVGGGAAGGFPHDWTSLEFSNDGKTILLGTNNNAGHILLDAFEGRVKAFLVRPEQYLPLKPEMQRATPWPGMMSPQDGGEPTTQDLGQGDVCLTSDARFVIGVSGGEGDLVVWDVNGEPETSKVLKPMASLPCRKKQGVIAFNPRYNMFVTGDTSVMMWIPDEHVGLKPP